MPRVDIYGFTGDADTYCPPCAEARWGPDSPERLDGEGNEPGVLFSTSDGGPWGAMCGACGDELLAPDGSLCECGDGCGAGDCPACDGEGPDEDPDEDSGCSCQACVDAAAWSQDVE